ncbi:MAG: tetratricopeptide repeat protein, partial [Myxococcales bacterium]|nr:tetratricopeptide repeat protein [Myxococcales bacterium]
MPRLRLVVAALVVAALAGDAAADQARARLRFETGRLLYQQGDYATAAKQFRAGYDELPRPEFLLNAGLCYARLHEVAAERELLERYLSVAEPSDPGRARARSLLDELAAAPAAPAAPTRSAETLAPIAPNSSPVAGVATARVERAHARGWRRWWWIAPVAGVVAAGVAVGIYFGVRHDS